MRFRDRLDAGQRLAEALAEYGGRTDAVVLALPRGGAVLGRVVADALHLPLGLVIPRKIGAPHDAEYAIGAVTERGAEAWNEAEKAAADSAWLSEEIRRQRDEAKRRRERYLGGRDRMSLKDKTVLIVDDGMATGLTMRVAILDVKSEMPQSVVVAVPVAPPDTVRETSRLADRVVVLSEPAIFSAIGAFYETFDQVEDDEVVRLLEDTI